MNDLVLLESSTLRNQLCTDDNIALLERVGCLIMLPDTEFTVTKSIADFYAVSEQTIKNLLFAHKEELTQDGYQVLKRKEVERFFPEIAKNYKITNRGLAIFSRRATLRIGMLLKESEVAKLVRTYLLSLEQKSTALIPQRENSLTMANHLTHQAGALVQHAGQLTTHADQITKQANQLMAQSRLISAIAEEVYQNRERVKWLENGYRSHEERLLLLEKNSFEKERERIEVESISEEQVRILREKVKHKGSSSKIWAKFKIHFGISRYIFLPKHQFQEALEWLEKFENE